MQLTIPNTIKINTLTEKSSPQEQNNNVAHPPSSISWARKMQLLNALPQPHFPSAKSTNIISLNSATKDSKLTVIDCTLGIPGHGCPRSKEYLNKILNNSNIESYTNPLGDPKDREIVAESLNERHAIEKSGFINSSNVAFTDGATGGYRNVLQAISGTLVVPDLCYSGYDSMRELIPNDKDIHPIVWLESGRMLPNAELIIEKLNTVALTQNKEMKDVEAIVVLTSPGNPNGKAYGREELLQILNAIKEYSKTKIIMDETYHAIFFEENQKLSALDVIESINPQLIILRSLSKGFGLPGMRGGLIIGDQGILNKIQALQFNTVVHANTFAQKLMTDSLKDYAFEKEVANFYKERVVPFHDFCKENNLVPKNETLKGVFFVLSNFIAMQGNVLSYEAQSILESFDYPKPIPTEVTDAITAAVDLFDKTKIIAVPWFREGASEEMNKTEYLLRFALVHKDNKVDKLIERLSNYLEFSNTTSESTNVSDSSDNERPSKKLKVA